VGFIVLLLCWCMGATILKLCFLFCFGFANVWRFDQKTQIGWICWCMRAIIQKNCWCFEIWHLVSNNSSFFLYSLIEAWANNLKVLSIFLFHLCMGVLVLEGFVFFFGLCYAWGFYFTIQNVTFKVTKIGMLLNWTCCLYHFCSWLCQNRITDGSYLSM
jgi:hypothetical protein